MEYDYNSIWSSDNYIFQPTMSGVTVYNSDASSIVSEVSMPGSNCDFEKYVYIDFDTHTKVDSFLIYMTIDPDNMVYSHTNVSGTDIHFKDLSGNELDFCLLNWEYNGYSDICIKVNLYGTDVIKMCFGNSIGNEFDQAIDMFLFYDTFNGTSLGSHWSSNYANHLYVNGGKLRVTTAANQYTWAWINNQQFTPPFIVDMKITNIDMNPEDWFTQMGVWLEPNNDGFNWYPDGQYDIRVYFNGVSTNYPGIDRGIKEVDTVLTTFIAEDSIRIKADRGVTSFDITVSGTTNNATSRDLYFFKNHNSTLYINYITVRSYSSGDDVGDYEYIESTIGDVLYYDYVNKNVPSSVWADDNYLYVSTTASGIFKSDLATIESMPQMVSYLNYPIITDNNVRYIHGNNDRLCVVTASGIDNINLTTYSGIYTLCDNGYKCFQTISGTFYYTEMDELISVVDENYLGGSLIDWRYYREITLSSSTSESNHRVLLEIEGFSYGHTQSNGEDIRFITEDGVILTYFIDTYTQDQYFKIVINVTTTGIDFLYMLYGNPNVDATTLQIDWEYPIISSSFSTEKSWPDKIAGKLHAMYDNTINWQENSVGYSYDIVNTIDQNMYYLNDIYVTENTSEYNNDNVIFLATNYGAVIIEERKGDENNSRIKKYYLQ